jgi:xanthine dehydrogenase small subunit
MARRSAIHLPRLAPGQIVAAYKVSKRRDEDISSVAMGISVVRHEGRITACRIAYGGMAATPRRAARAEAVLCGHPGAGPRFMRRW